MYSDFYAYAERIARRVSDADSFMVCALHIRAGKPIGYGVNRTAYRKGFSYYVSSLHAEADLANKMGKALYGDKVFVYRFNRAQPFGDARISKPCPLCARILLQYGVSRVGYIGVDGPVVEKLTNIPHVNYNPATLTMPFDPDNPEWKSVRFNIEEYLA